MAASTTAPETFGLEIIDVFTDPRRALTDGVLVTPTLIGISPKGRTTIMGDLTDSEPLRRLLAQLAASSTVG
jgi:circadian clock protein KaiB